jgi:uncharacterized membrane protein
MQGAIAGAAFGALYAIGFLVTALWTWVGMPLPAAALRRRLAFGVILTGAGAILFGLVRIAFWQESVHRVMGLPPVEAGFPARVALVGAGVAIVLILIGKGCLAVSRAIATRLKSIMPERLAMLLGLAVAGGLLVTLANGLLLRTAIKTMDSAYQRVDRFLPPDKAAPSDPAKTGGPSSLVAWRSLGSEGRNRISSYPSRAEIEAVTGHAAREPLRVYVGLNSAKTASGRAALALAEMRRTGAFDRSMLVIATPTGTGWIDPASMAPVEMLQHGDIASVSVQYSYLPSWLSLFVEPEFGVETAKAVFSAVYGHWRTLPKDKRPRLFLTGLSLGSLNSDLAADFYDVIDDPHDGAFWIGAPFASRTWRQVIRERRPGTPVWAPEFRNNSLIRVLTGRNPEVATAPGWGAMRIVYLNYPSDPIVHFQTSSLLRKPAWMDSPRASDVSPEVRWLPIVSMLQHGLDMMIATQTPRGYGHVYAATHYLDGWIAATDPQGWDTPAVERLRAALKDRGL